VSTVDPLPSDEPPPIKHTLTTAKFEAVNAPTATPTPAPTDVHQVLWDNLARENAAGLNVVKPAPKRPSRRKRDFWLVLIGGNLAIMASVGFTSINVVSVVYGFAGIILLSSGLIWIMWFVMDDY
jgi:hypothetical protein